MKKLTATITIDIGTGFMLDDKDEIKWFHKEVLTVNGGLSLYSDEVGDTVGVVTEIKNIHVE